MNAIDGSTAERGMAPRDFNPSDLAHVARSQKTLLWVLLVSILCSRFPVLVLLMTIPSVWAILVLARSIRLERPWLPAVFAALPLANLVVLFVVNSRATKLLRRHGVPVGFMGVAADYIRSMDEESLRR